MTYRYTTPDKRQFNEMMKKLNILEKNKVVIYNSISAAKLWWIMNYYGHPNSFILDGGMRQWNKLKYPVNTHKSPIDYSDTDSDTFKAKDPDTSKLVELDEILERLKGELT